MLLTTYDQVPADQPMRGVTDGLGRNILALASVSLGQLLKLQGQQRGERDDELKYDSALFHCTADTQLYHNATDPYTSGHMLCSITM